AAGNSGESSASPWGRRSGSAAGSRSVPRPAGAPSSTHDGKSKKAEEHPISTPRAERGRNADKQKPKPPRHPHGWWRFHHRQHLYIANSYDSCGPPLNALLQQRAVVDGDARAAQQICSGGATSECLSVLEMQRLATAREQRLTALLPAGCRVPARQTVAGSPAPSAPQRGKSTSP